MKTGTDISIPECRKSGYPVVEHDMGKLYVNTRYILTISNPEAWSENGKRKPNQSNPYLFHDRVSYNEMWRLFNIEGVGIKKYCDWKNCPLPSPEESPTFQDYVSLASILHGYCGLPV